MVLYVESAVNVLTEELSPMSIQAELLLADGYAEKNMSSEKTLSESKHF